MNIIRNREIKRFVFLLILVSFVFSLAGFFINKETGLLVTATCVILCTFFMFFTVYRYRQIGKLSSYLRRICAGEYSLDIRDNDEGELSILKNDIYKVTLMLTEYNELLKKEKLLLSEHMADISHQLKTPLTSMMVMVDLLKDDNLPQDKRREFTTHIYSQLERIEWLVSSLLKMSKLDAGVVKMSPREVSAYNLVREALEPLLITMELKEINYFIDGEDLNIKCDKNWTVEALLNILKNCVEHTHRGGKIQITVSENPIYTEISISDNGSGISPKDLPHIFTRFYKGENSSADSVGIGLAMAKSIIKSQMGDIAVKSKPGEGSVFSVRFYNSIV